MKKNIWKHLIVLAAIIIVTAPIVHYNIKNNSKFLKSSATSVISMISVFYVSYYLVQWKNDTREKIKRVESLIYEIKDIINSKELYAVANEEERQKALMLHRKVANKIRVLETYNFDDNAKEQVEILKEKFLELREFIGEHINDNDYMQKSRNEIERRVMKLDDILDIFCVKLHR